MTDFFKGAGAVLDYSIDWTSFLAGDTISTSTWAAESTGITIDSETEAGAVTTVTLSSGVLHREYAVTNTIVTTAGRTATRTIYIHIVNREE